MEKKYYLNNRALYLMTNDVFILLIVCVHSISVVLTAFCINNWPVSTISRTKRRCQARTKNQGGTMATHCHRGCSKSIKSTNYFDTRTALIHEFIVVCFYSLLVLNPQEKLYDGMAVKWPERFRWIRWSSRRSLHSGGNSGLKMEMNGVQQVDTSVCYQASCG